MEIKQGDMVRVSKATPNMYLVGFGYAVIGDECKVREIDEGNALIKWKDNYITIPTKYLIKVDAEAKKPKFCIGDRVRVSGGVLDGGVFTIMDRRFDGGGWIYELSIRACIGESCLEPYTEPKEQTEADEVICIRQMETELDEFRKAELDRVLHPEKYHTYEVMVDNVAMDWQRYEADLAKEIALKVANKKMDNHPEEISAYAVQVAKAVVEGLKRK